MTLPRRSKPPTQIEMRRCPECGVTSMPHDTLAHDWDCSHDFEEGFDGYETLTYVLKPKPCETCRGCGYVGRSVMGQWAPGMGYGTAWTEQCPDCRGRKVASS
jgi:hypothetical protein